MAELAQRGGSWIRRCGRRTLEEDHERWLVTWEVRHVEKRKSLGVRPGDRVKVRFGFRDVEGVVTSVWGGQVHVQLDIDGADEPVAGLYDERQLALL